MPSAPEPQATCPEPVEGHITETCPEPVEGHISCYAVVLAGGASRRFGTDKLAARLGPDSLLERSLRGLPADTDLTIVGPERPGLSTGRPTRYVREEPPGGGPAAALVAGLQAVLDRSPSPDATILVLPGDAPEGGRASILLRYALDALFAETDVVGVVGLGADEQLQPLQLALRPAGADALIVAAGPDHGHGASARRVIGRLGPALRAVPLPELLHADIDTADDLERWRNTQR